jgi:hypothetical protein
MKKPFSPLHDVRHWLKYSPVVRIRSVKEHHDTGLAKYRVSDGPQPTYRKPCITPEGMVREVS